MSLIQYSRLPEPYARQQVAAHPTEKTDVARLARIEMDAAGPLANSNRGAVAISMLDDARGTLQRLLEDEPRNIRYREHMVEPLDIEGDTYELVGAMPASCGCSPKR